MSSGIRNFPPIAPEDLEKLGFESQLIPFIISTISRAEQASNGLPLLSPAEAENFVEILDKVVSSAAASPSLKNRCFRALRKVSSAHAVLPKSYFPPGVALTDTIPYASGEFADIWKGNQDGNPVCVKAFRTQTAGHLDMMKRRFYREIVAWKYVSHPNVLPFLGVSETLFSFCIISPWLLNGNIVEHIQKNRGVNRWQLLAQAACGLEYLHSLSIVHSDINPGNILITEEGNVRLGDFGIVDLVTNPAVVESYRPTTPKTEGVCYRAPELLNPSQFNLANSNPSKESDIYSLAMTAYEILTGIRPYGNAWDGTIISHVTSGVRPPRPTDTRWLPDQLWDMVIACWSDKREQRWDIRTVYNQFSTSSIQDVPDAEPGCGLLSAPVPSYRPVPKDLEKLGVEPQLIPFVISTILQVEQLPNGSPPLSSAEAGSLVEALDKVVSSAAANLDLRKKCLRVLREVSSTHGFLPKSYSLPGVTLSDTAPYACGGFAGTWKGQQDENRVCVKAFLLQKAASMDKVKRRFYHEIVGWKYVSHPNVQPFLGVSEKFPLCIINPWLPNGNIAEYTRKNQGVNRLKLLAQAACGLEYLHSRGIVHGDVNPGNILITKEGNVRLGDFGITSAVVDNTVMESGSTTTSRLGVVRYMAPELLDPPQFGLADTNPSKESDVYSFAMTAYETLTDTLPYGRTRDGIIIFYIVTGKRPPRPARSGETRWLQDSLWNMITECWSEKREQRWDIHAVYSRISTQGNDDSSHTHRHNPLPTLKDPDPPAQQKAGTKPTKRGKRIRSPTSPISDKPKRSIPKRQFTFTSRPRSGRDDTGEPEPGPSDQGKRARKAATYSRGWSQLRRVTKVASALVRFRQTGSKVR